MVAPQALRTVRLISGLVLMTFVTCHLANLAIGMHSLAAMEAWRAKLSMPWTRGPGQWLLVLAASVHVALGLYAIASRRSLTLSRTDVVQLILGLLTPPLLMAHVVAMYAANKLAPGFDSNYGQILAVYWSFAPFYAFQQLFVVVIVWIHGAVGLYSWLVLKPVWRRIGGLVLPLLFALPILALIGFAESGKEVLARLANDPAWSDYIANNIRPIAKLTRELGQAQAQAFIIYVVLVLAAIGILAARVLRDRRRPIGMSYDGGLDAQGRWGLSVLEFSRLNDIAHANVCSGRGRCGTCRVQVDTGAASLSPMSEAERETLLRVDAATEGVRLACQARVLGHGVVVTRLLPPYADATAARQPEAWAAS
ncbi:MAG: 2Fe-2S iron-sulfur cluster-binding protein [Burkholderiales bacterium]